MAEQRVREFMGKRERDGRGVAGILAQQDGEPRIAVDDHRMHGLVLQGEHTQVDYGDADRPTEGYQDLEVDRGCLAEQEAAKLGRGDGR